MPRAGKLQVIKYAPPPPELPVYGKVGPNQVSYIGRTNYIAALEEKKFIFGIKRIDRRQHVYTIGKSGVGKSKFLELLIRQDIAAGYGLCVIDPDGNLIDSILDFIPENRAGDVCIIDPSDVQYPMSFNPLAGVDRYYKHQFTQSLIEILKKQLETNWNPRIEQLFRFACLALLDYPNATMQGLISIITDSEYRKKVAEHIQDDMIRHFWTIEFPDRPEKFDSDVIIPLVNKLSQFFHNPILNNIFNQEENGIDIEKLIRENKIILVHLAKDKLGEENSSFFGSMFIMKIKQAGMSRASIPESQRQDFYLYVDEFQNLVTETFENLLSEARKYGLYMTMAHQYMGQLLPRVQAAVLGNIGNIVIFRVGGEDAERLEAEMTPVFKSKDMINLGMQEFYIKMTIDGETYDPFSAETLKVLRPPGDSLKKNIIEASHQRYSVSVGGRSLMNRSTENNLN